MENCWLVSHGVGLPTSIITMRIITTHNITRSNNTRDEYYDDVSSTYSK